MMSIINCKSKCLCGRKAVGITITATNVYAGIYEIKKETPVCEYHLDKAKKMNLQTKKGAQHESNRRI
mgnify:CR=1 FL=1|jgi:hypothetical protein